MPDLFPNHKWVIDITSGPGGGKDTLALNLQRLLIFCYPELKESVQIVGMSDCLRNQIKLQLNSDNDKDKLEAREIENVMKEGGAVEFEFIKKAFETQLVSALSKKRIIILTGVSRNEQQAKMVELTIKKFSKVDGGKGQDLPKNQLTHLRIFIDVPEKILKSRLNSRGREDDKNDDAIKLRLKIWEKNGHEVLKYWKEQFLYKLQIIRTSKKFINSTRKSKIDYLKQLRPILKAYNLQIKKKLFKSFTESFVDE